MIVHNHYPDHLTTTLLHRATPAEVGARLASLSRPFALRTDTDDGLMLARDHLGIEPMFYTFDGKQGWVAAPTVGEIFDVLAEPTPRLRETSVVAHINGSAPTPGATFFEGIHSVTPGTLLRLGPHGHEQIVYWDPATISQNNRLELADAAVELRELLYEVIEDQALGAPVAATFSAGLDSTAVMMALAETGADVLAVTWTSPEVPGSEEGDSVRRVAANLGIRLVEIPIHAKSLLPESGIITRRSNPIFSIFDHVWRVVCSRVAAEERRSLFTGFSGEHVFGGWIPAAADLFAAMRWTHLRGYLARCRDDYPSLPSAIRSELLSPLFRQLSPGLWARRRGPVPWLEPTLDELWTEHQRNSMGPPGPPARAQRIARLSDGVIPLLAEDLAAQARPHNVRLHHPLLDRRVVEFALSLPSWLLDDGQAGKLVLGEAVGGVVSDDLVDLDDELPVTIAVEAMRAREEELIALTRDMRAADLGFVSEPILANRVRGFMQREHDDMSFWNTLTLEDWLRRWW